MTIDRLQDSSETSGLLAMLRSKGLVRSSEVVVTTSIAWLAQRPGAATALDVLIIDSGLTAGSDPSWRAEVRAQDGTRTDLEIWWGEPAAPRVVIEAKLDASLTAAQLTDYMLDLRGRLAEVGGDALVVVLVPAHRRDEAKAMLEAAWSEIDNPGLADLRKAVWDYDQVLGALQAALGNDPDLAQLRVFIRACEALDIKPFTRSQLLEHPEVRELDLVALADRVTTALHPVGQRLLTSGRNDPDYQWRRYLEVTPGGTNIAVGVRYGSGTTPIWLRVHMATLRAVEAGQRLRQTFAAAETDSATGHTWLPLTVPLGVGGAAIVDSLVEQVAHAIQAIGEEAS